MKGQNKKSKTIRRVHSVKSHAWDYLDEEGPAPWWQGASVLTCTKCWLHLVPIAALPKKMPRSGRPRVVWIWKPVFSGVILKSIPECKEHEGTYDIYGGG